MRDRQASVGSPSTAVGELDHRHLWHPFTQQRDWCAEEPLVIERAEGTELVDSDGKALHRRRLVAVVQRPRPSPSPDRRGGARAARPGRPLDDARPHPPRRGGAGRAPGRARAARARSRLLFGLGLERDRDRPEDGLSVLAAARRAAPAAHVLHLPARRLPWRHPGRGVGGRHRPLPLPPIPRSCSGRIGWSRATPSSSSACSTSTRRRSRR